MPKDLLKENVATGKVVYEWLIKEYDQYSRSKRWYLVAGLVFVALVAWGIATANYLFAFIIVLVGIVLYLNDMQEPMDVYFAITETGIVLGKKFYNFGELSGFWFIYNPPEVKKLYFTVDTVFKHRLQVQLMDYDPRPVREYLSQFLTENTEEQEEPLSDRLSRIFKIQ